MGYSAEAYSDPCHASKIERFAELLNGAKSLSLFAKDV